jgi:hypothetical protein
MHNITRVRLIILFVIITAVAVLSSVRFDSKAVAAKPKAGAAMSDPLCE